MSEPVPPAQAAVPQPKWQPLGRIERRVLGVLVEKAKTTPEAYPLTLNALTNGCNQKSNRDPQMNLESDAVEEALENLRKISAVVEVVGSGRVPKYRHMMYEWMGVDKAEAAVMTELLLRGPQTIGELRGRAARMEPIADVGALRPILDSLIQKRLLLSLTAAGRGQIVTHNLYPADELQKIQASVKQTSESGSQVVQADAGSAGPRRPHQPTTGSAPGNASNDALDQLRQELDELKGEVTRLRNEVNDLWSNLR
jgi:uncharacterized protein YceH (UPF0502 family)